MLVMIQRAIKEQLVSSLKKGQVTVLLGARRTGKTVLMEQIKNDMADKKVLMLNGEDYDVAGILSSKRQSVLKNLVAGYDYLFVDEAQNIPEIGANLKLLVDSVPEISVFITGSAAFDLRNKIGEPLTGRSRFFYLYPFSVSEITHDYYSALQQLQTSLIFGNYPQVFEAVNDLDRKIMLENIRNGYLLKDVLQLDNLKDSLFIMNLLRNIAFQIGNDISYNEIASNLNTTVKTVQRYLDILEKSYILFRLNGFSRNLRKEFSKTPRYFFWDNGIRNSIISNYSNLEMRDDVGRLWENFCISERLKRQTYVQTFSNFYFWRTYDQQEIDLIEETDSKLYAFEFKWGEKEASNPKAFRDNYPDASFKTINRGNFYDFLS
jgi:predicted AAA+ superfamily ATPase